jgi:hypothetical protein
MEHKVMHLFDSNRGVKKQLRSDTTGAELTAYSDLLTSFDSDGFSLGADTSVGDVNMIYNLCSLELESRRNCCKQYRWYYYE